MSRRSVRQRLIEAAEFLPEEFTAPDHPDPAVVHNVPYLLDPFPGRPPKVRPSKAGEVVYSPSTKYCIHCGCKIRLTVETTEVWAKLRRCRTCSASSGKTGGRRYCMNCGAAFVNPEGKSGHTTALCDPCRDSTAERKLRGRKERR